MVKKHMMDEGLAIPYYEPEGLVISRTGDTCLVANCYQWFIKYGEENWKNFVQDHVLSDNFNTFNPKTLNSFKEVLNWLEEWGCTRT